MNCPTTRYSTPAAADRMGEVARGTLSKTSIPFAAIPHDIAADPRLSSTDVRVLAALLYFAKADTCCWPCDNSIADRVHCHPGTIQRSLRYLEDLGYIRRQPSRENPTGRLIHLTCREPDWERPPQAPIPSAALGGISAALGGINAVLAKGDVVVEGLKTEECALPERSRLDPAPPPVDLPTPVAAVPLQAKVPTRVPPAPVIEPSQPVLLVTTPAPVMAPQEPQFRPLRKVRLGPQAACPTRETPPPVRSLSTSCPGPGPALLSLTPEEQAGLPHCQRHPATSCSAGWPRATQSSWPRPGLSWCCPDPNPRHPRPCPSCWGGSGRTRPTLPWRHLVWQQPSKIRNLIRDTCVAVRRHGEAS